jgi:exopolysaccharide biosynthesis predicted pyruvyltransferase EpsI
VGEVKPYNVTKHAIDRAVERLGVKAEYAANHIVQLMQSAYYQGDTQQSSGKTVKIFDHHKTRTRIVIGDSDTVISVYKFPEIEVVKPAIFADEIKRLIKRQLTKAQREFTRTYRSLEINAAELNIEIAQLRLNHAKARSPKIQASIKAKLDELMTQYTQVEAEIKQASAKFEQIKNGAEAYL